LVLSLFFTLSLHDALPIFFRNKCLRILLTTDDTVKPPKSKTPNPKQTPIPNSQAFTSARSTGIWILGLWCCLVIGAWDLEVPTRSEEHTSELQSLRHLVCR